MRILFLTLLLIIVTQYANAQRPSSYVTVIDGDRLKMGYRQVRLHGIDAPEDDSHHTAAGSGRDIVVSHGEISPWKSGGPAPNQLP